MLVQLLPVTVASHMVTSLRPANASGKEIHLLLTHLGKKAEDGPSTYTPELTWKT